MDTTTATSRLTIGLTLAGLLAGSPAVGQPPVTVQPYRGTDHIRGLDASATVGEARRLDGATGYVRITAFGGRTVPELERSLHALGRLERLVLDLRGNTGGRLDAAREVAELFVPAGAALYIERSGLPRLIPSRGPGRFAALTVDVLIDERTASAAEVLAGALRFGRGARLLGTRSAGKGSIITAEPEEDGRVRWIAAGEIRLVDGTPISGRGLDPVGPIDAAWPELGKVP